jgi:hypothetical protein
MWSSYKANLPIDGIHIPPIFPERKRSLLQMLRIEKHFEKKLNKIAAANQEADNEGKPRPKSSSSLNTIRFNQL